MVTCLRAQMRAVPESNTDASTVPELVACMSDPLLHHYQMYQLSLQTILHDARLL
jgi:hypothetical protein